MKVEELSNDDVIDHQLTDQCLAALRNELLNVDYSHIKVPSAKIHPDWESVFRMTQQKVTEELGTEFTLSEDLANFSFYAFPSVSSEVASSILIFNMAAFVLDDYLEKYPVSEKVPAGGQSCTENEKIIQQLRNKDFSGNGVNDKWCRLAIKVCAETFGEMDHNQLLDYLIIWLSKAVEANEIFTGQTTANDIEYLELRCIDSGAAHQFFLALIGAGKQLTDELKNDPNYLGLNKQAAIQASLVNDLYSLRKEIRDKIYKYNYVYVKMKNNNCTAQAAVNDIIDEIYEAERMARVYGGRLKELNDPNLSRYVDGIYELMDGNHYWSTFCKRYNANVQLGKM